MFEWPIPDLLPSFLVQVRNVLLPFVSGVREFRSGETLEELIQCRGR